MPNLMKHLIVAWTVGTAIAAKTRLRPRSESVAGFERSLPSFYHTSQELKDELQKVAENCPEMMLRTETASYAGRSVELDVVSIKGNGQPKNKAFLLFGEHARELISAESGLHFVKTVCEQKDVLRNNEFMMVLNANPGSRATVEQGDWCLRVNPNGVDLNRNWDEHWEGDASYGTDTNPGQGPFSEAETQLLKKLVSSYEPTTFLTIHSGTLGMYMPWAFDMQHLADRNLESMMQILQKVDEDHCQCPFGAAGREVGYSCPGTCLDWVFDKLKTPYAFAYEIYYGGSPDELRERWQEKVHLPGASLIQAQSLAHPHFKDLYIQYPSSFIQVASQHHEENNALQGFACFGMFNPDTEEKYRETVENWSKAYLDTVEQVALKL